MPASFPLVQQAHARCRWDGEVAAGMIEGSSMLERMDFWKNVRKIKG
jgi:hypothetical protein